MSIAHANKDIVSKVLNQNYKNKSFKVYGLDLPKIKQMLPTDYPVISSEYRGDGAFLLEDDSLLLQEYESSARNSNFIKYLQYILALTKALASEGIKITNVIVAVIYTGDILTAPSVYDLGAVRITIKQVFLSKFDTAAIYSDIKAKISQKQQLTDEDVMRLIILPLTQPIKAEKQGLIEDTVNLAKQVDDDEQQRFILAGILTATDKFINRDYANQIMEMMNMTKVEQLFEEKFRAKYKAEQELEREKWLQEQERKMQQQLQKQEQKMQQKQEQKTKQKLIEKSLQMAKAMLENGEDVAKIALYSQLSHEEIFDLQNSIAT